MTIRLHDEARLSPKRELFIVFKGTHNDTWLVAGKEYITKMEKFIKECFLYQRPEKREVPEGKKKVDEKDADL